MTTTEKLNLNKFGQSERQYSLLEGATMRANTYNSTPGKLTGYDCSECLNRGDIAFPLENGGLEFHDCKCMKTRKCLEKMERSGLKNIIREKTFEAFQVAEPWQQTLKDGAIAYANNPNGWLLFCGQSGSGKTHLCTAVARQRLLEGDEVLYMPWREKAAELKAMALDNESRAKLLHEYTTAQILYIDDLFKVGRNADGTSNPTAADIGLAFEILNQRYINDLPTIISTEKTPQELFEIDEATGGRAIEKAGTNVFSINRDARRNYRMRGVKNL